jgi:hypothetical protein
MKQARKPNAIVEIKTGDGGDGKAMQAWDYGEVYMLTPENNWTPHPKYPGQHRSFTIELLSDVIPFNHQSHLACYTGKTPFCFRAHRGLDDVGVARRRDPEGGLFNTECNPDKCPIRQNKLEPDSRAVEIFEKWSKIYEYAKLVSKDRKGKTVTAKCMAYHFFIFNLLLPDGSYAHPEGEFCMLASKSDTTANRITAKLRDLSARCNGRIAGLRLNLVFRPVETRFGSPRPAWDLRVPDDCDFEEHRMKAAQRLQSRQFDYLALPPDAISTALVKCHAEQNLAQWVAAEHPDVMREENTLALHQYSVQAEMIDPASTFLINQHPTIQALIQRCQTSYATETYLPKQFGTDVRRCIEWYKGYAAKHDIDLSDILGTGGEYSTVVLEAKLDACKDSGEQAVRDHPQEDDGILDAEIVEVQPEDPPVDLDAMQQAVRGKPDPMVQDLKDILEGKK